MTAAAAVTAGRRAYLAVLAAFFVNGLLFASWAAHIPKIKARLDISDGTLGFALLGTPIGSVSAMAVCGYLLPKVGSRIVVQVSLAGYCVSGPFVGLADSVGGLFVALFAWGAFQGSLDVAMNTQAIAVEQHQGRPLMNGIHAWWSIGAFAGAGAGTVGVALGSGLAPQLVVLGVPALLVAGLLSARMLPDAAPARDVVADPAPGVAAEPRPRRRISGAMLVLGGVALASMLCEGAAADWSSVYLRDSLDTGTETAGLGYTAFSLAMVVVRIFGNRLLLRFPMHRLLPSLALLATAAVAVTLAAGSAPVAIAGFFVLGLGLGAVVPAAFSAAGRLPGLHAGVGVAGVSALGWVGFVFGPPFIGQLADLSSLPIALIVVPVLTAFIALACARAVSLREPPEAQPDPYGSALT